MLRTLIFTTVLLFFYACGEGGGGDSAKNDDKVNPDPFTFATVSSAEINTFYTSNEINISGLLDSQKGELTITGGALLVNGVEANGSSSFVGNDDRISIKLKSGSDYGISTKSKIALGKFSTDFIVTTALDTIVNNFIFNDISDASLSTEYISNTITISGLGVGIDVEASISGGTIIYNKSEITTNTVTVKNGDTIAIKLTTNGEFSSVKESVLAVGSVQDTFSVTTFPDVSSVSLSPSSATIEVDSSTVLSFTVNPANAPAGVSFSSSDTSVATVSATGVVEAIGVGVATITATSTYNNQKYATATISVVSELPTVAPNSITVSPSLAVLSTAEVKVLDALPFPSGSSVDLVWGSSDPNVATVSSDGNVTAVAPGKATITAYSNDDMNINGSMTVYVEIYESLDSVGDLDTVGSVVDSVLDTSGTTLFFIDSAPGVKAYSLAVDGNSTDTTTTLSLLDTLNVTETTEAIKLSSDDTKLYLANGYYGIREIDVNDTSSLAVSNIYTSGYSSSGKFAADIAVSADSSKAFVATRTGIEWLTLDTIITSNDTQILSSGGTSYKLDLTSDDKRVLLASGSEGLKIYDIVGGTFSLLATYASSSCDEVVELEISKDDRNIYLGCANGLIEIINIEDLTSIVLRGSYQTTQKIESLKLSDDEDRLYITNGTMGVIILDTTFYNTITAKLEPRAVSAYNTVGFAKDIELTTYLGENVAIVSDGGNGLLLIK